jgi:hypothetical protein
MKRLSDLTAELSAIHKECTDNGIRITSNYIDEGDADFSVDFGISYADNNKNIWEKSAEVTYDNVVLSVDDDKFKTLETIFQKHGLIPSQVVFEDGNGVISFEQRGIL